MIQVQALCKQFTSGRGHISALADTRVEKVTDVVKEGDTVRVRLVAIDDRGRLSLSMKPSDLSA